MPPHRQTFQRWRSQSVAIRCESDSWVAEVEVQVLHVREGRVVGAEGFGLSDATVIICQRKVTIPLQSGVDSLNAAVASGIVLYHFSQRM